MPYATLLFSRHARQRMFERKIAVGTVEYVLQRGTVIKQYPDEKPFPAYLMLGFVHDRPVHVVAADDDQANETHIITVYEPVPEKWDPDFRTRKP